MTSTILRERLVTLIRAVFDGNVNAAAEAAGMGPSTLHRVVEGKVAEPRLGTIQKLAAAYGVPLGWLLGEFDSDEAQARAQGSHEAIILPLPRDYWLVYSFHRSRQDKLRTWLATTKPKSARAKKIVSDFTEFTLAIASDESPLAKVGDLVAVGEDRVGDAELSIVRRFAELESDVLELAVRQAKRAETKGE